MTDKLTITYFKLTKDLSPSSGGFTHNKYMQLLQAGDFYMHCNLQDV